MARAKKVVQIRCHICKKVISKPYYKTGMTNRSICSDNCKNWYFQFGNLPEIERPKEMIKEILFIFAALCSVESNNDCSAVGDDGKAKGILQIHKSAIIDVNNFYHTNYNHDDAFDEIKSKDIFIKYLTIYGKRYQVKEKKEVTSEILAKIWNGGPNGYLKESTEAYWKKVKKELILD